MIARPSRALGLAVAALGFICTWPSSARAETKLEVTAAPVKPEVTVGDDIEVQVTVKNVGEDADLTELTFDARSVSFELSVDGGKTAWDAQFNVKPGEIEMTTLKRAKLKAGESWTKKMPGIPAIASGVWSVTAVYAGASPDIGTLPGIEPKLVKAKSAASTVKVNPGAKGETQVVAKVNTNQGTMTFKFFPKDALTSGMNFVRIARTGWYDGKNFHRVDKSLGIVQGGAPKPDGSGDFPYSIPREQGLKHEPLKVGMARTGEPNSGSSQWYICVNSSPSVLDRPDGYAIFAEGVKGKDVVQTLFGVDVNGQTPKTPLKIESVKLQLAPAS